MTTQTAGSLIAPVEEIVIVTFAREIKERVMRATKIKISDFASVFTSRNLGFRERYMQEFLFIDMDGFYEIHQKLNLAGKLLTLALMPILLIFVFMSGGVKDSYDFITDSFSYVIGKSVRKDFCHKDHEKTIELVKIAGWEKC